MKLRERSAGAMVICFVHSKKRGSVGSTDSARDLLIARHDTLATVNDEDEEVCIGNCTLPAIEYQLVERILTRAEHAAGIGELETYALPLDRLRDHVTRRSRSGCDDRAARLGQTIEQRRFADVRSSDEHDRWEAPHKSPRFSADLTA